MLETKLKKKLNPREPLQRARGLVRGPVVPVLLAEVDASHRSPVR